MPYIKFPFSAGIFPDESPLKAKGYFSAGNGARSHRGGMESNLGFEKSTTDTFLGKCRFMNSWKDFDLTAHTFLGTHLRAYIYSDAQIYDITPVLSRGVLTSTFSTTDEDETVTVAHTGHDRTIDSKVTFPDSISVGGLNMQGSWAVTTIATNSYTFEHTSEATSSVSTTGTTDYEYGILPGQEFGIGGAGFGTGVFGSGTYGSPNTEAVFARTYSAAPWGENLLFNPRSDGLYEFNPTDNAYVRTELILTGDFASDTNWTKGANWSIGSGVATAATASSDLSQNISLVPGAHYLLDFDVTAFTSGSVRAYAGSTAITIALAATGTYKTEFYSGSGGTVAIKFTGASLIGAIDNVSVTQLTTGRLVPNAPTQADSMFVTPERIAVLLGTIGTDGLYDNLLVRWCDQENNEDWTATATNVAGDFKLPNGGRIVRGIPTRGENLIFTLQSVFSMRFVPDPNVVYRFDQVGEVGLIGQNAVVATDSGVFWMGNGEFYVYRGGVPQPLSSPYQRDVYDNLEYVQQDLIAAYSNKAKNEVTWSYPDKRDSGQEVSRCVTYNYVEQTWSGCIKIRPFQLDRSIEEYPVSADAAGQMRYEEKGFSADGAALSGSLQTGYFDIGDGDTQALVRAILPDFEDLQGGLTVKVFVRNNPNETPREFGPFNISSSTGKINVRARGRSVSLLFEWDSAPFFMRLGAIRIDIERLDVRRAAA